MYFVLNLFSLITLYSSAHLHLYVLSNEYLFWFPWLGCWSSSTVSSCWTEAPAVAGVEGQGALWLCVEGPVTERICGGENISNPGTYSIHAPWKEDCLFLISQMNFNMRVYSAWFWNNVYINRTSSHGRTKETFTSLRVLNMRIFYTTSQQKNEAPTFRWSCGWSQNSMKGSVCVSFFCKCPYMYSTASLWGKMDQIMFQRSTKIPVAFKDMHRINHNVIKIFI